MRWYSDSVQHDVEDLLEYCVTIPMHHPNVTIITHMVPLSNYTSVNLSIGKKQAWQVTHGDRATNTQTWEIFIHYMTSQVIGWSDWELPKTEPSNCATKLNEDLFRADSHLLKVVWKVQSKITVLVSPNEGIDKNRQCSTIKVFWNGDGWCSATLCYYACLVASVRCKLLNHFAFCVQS